MQLHLLGWPEDGPRLDLDHERFAYAGHFGTGRTGLAVALVDDAVRRGDENDGERSDERAGERGDERADGPGHEGADGPGDERAGGPGHEGADDPGDERAEATEPDSSGHEPTARDASDVDPTALDASEVLAAASFDPDRAADGALRVRYVAVREDRRGEGIGARLLGFVVDRARERGFGAVRIGVNNPAAYQAGYRAGFAFTGEESGMGELVLEAPCDDRASDRTADRTDDRFAERYRDGLERFSDRDLPDAQRSVVERNRDAAPPTRRG